MIRKILHNKTSSIAAAALFVAASSLVSRVLGLIRDRILAGSFGAGDTLDVYYAAFRLPDLVYNLLVLGALSAGFIPVFTQLLSKDSDEAVTDEGWRLMNNIFSILLILLSALLLFVAIFARPLAGLFAPGFSGDKLEATVALTRIMVFSPLLLGLSAVMGGVLQSTKRFLIYSLAPIMYNLGIIFGALVFVPLFGIIGLAFGVVLGALLHFCIQLPTMFQLGWQFKPVIDFADKSVRKIAVMMVPRTLSLAVGQVDLLVSTAIASTLASGSLAVFNFANNIQIFPVGIFGIAFATAVFPTLAALADKRDQFVASFSSTIKQIWFFIIPATVFFIIFRSEIIRLLLGVGQFSWENTKLTYEALTFFVISLFAQSAIPLLVRSFYARHNSRQPFYIGVVAVAADVFFSLWFSRIWGVAGIALAFSISSTINFFGLWLLLRRELKNLDERSILISTSKFILAAVVAGGITLGLKSILHILLPMDRTIGILLQSGLSGSLGLLEYVLICHWLGCTEAQFFWQKLAKKSSFLKTKLADQGEARGI